MKKSTYHVFFKNLANPIKMKIITSLYQKDSSVGELSNFLGIEQSKLSHALCSLKTCSIVDVKPIGRKRVYSLNKQTIVPILNIIDEHEKKFCRNCPVTEVRK